MNNFHFVIICAISGVSIGGTNVLSGISHTFVNCIEHGNISGILNCAAERAIKTIELASEQKKLEILPGVELISIYPSSSRTAKNLILQKFPSNTQEKNQNLVKQLLNATARFISGRMVHIKLSQSSTETISRALEEGRGKMKKLSPIILGLGALMTLVLPLMMGGLSLLSAKALIIGKVALVLSLILLLQGFFTGSMGGTNILPYFGNGLTKSTPYGVNYPNNFPYGPGTNTLGGWNMQDNYPYARSFSHKQTAGKS
ncbi:hypothetical protein JTB14_035740 [Gonioctena quinquepunctata]|nr:hypothetical protein JTB14_035740 [Gonioctena quinquepunctata]